MKLNFKFFISGLIIGSVSITAVSAANGIAKAVFNENKLIFEGSEIAGLRKDDFVMMSITKEGETNSSNYAEVREFLGHLGYYVQIDREKNIVDISTAGGLAQPKYSLNPVKTIPNSIPPKKEEKKETVSFPDPPAQEKKSPPSRPESADTQELSYLSEEEMKNIFINSSWNLIGYEYIISLYENGKFVFYSREVGKQPEVDIGTYTISGSQINVKYSGGYYINDEGKISTFADYPEYGIYSVMTSEDKTKIYITMGSDSGKYYEHIEIPLKEYYQEP